MPRPPIQTDHLRNVLARRGVTSSGELTRELAISRPTLAKLVAALGSSVVRFGNARATHYGLRRVLAAGLANPLRLYRVELSGQVTDLGLLHCLYREQTLHDVQNGNVLLYEGMPPWVDSMRPQGYLGRGFAHRHPELNLPDRPEDWGDPQSLIALSAGEDAPGALLVGERALQVFLAPIVEVSRSDYPMLAEQAGRGEAGSSPGGEFPKFVACVEGRHVLVKFTSSEASPSSARWRDLLACEHLALSTLNRHGISAASSALYDIGERRYLEVERFDRLGMRGRRGMLSLQSVFMTWGEGVSSNWSQAVASLVPQGRVSAEECDRVELLEAYSVFILNTDRHFGNLSFFTDYVSGPLTLTPAYDVLPMALAPSRSGYIPCLPEHTPIITGRMAIASQALSMAQDFWQSVVLSEWVSEEMQSLAKEMTQRLAHDACALGRN